jgi:hypothetical protein
MTPFSALALHVLGTYPERKAGYYCIQWVSDSFQVKATGEGSWPFTFTFKQNGMRDWNKAVTEGYRHCLWRLETWQIFAEVVGETCCFIFKSRRWQNVPSKSRSEASQLSWEPDCLNHIITDIGQTGSGALPASYSVDTWKAFLGGRMARLWIWPFTYI